MTDNVTPATALVFGPTAAGDTSATNVIHAWYNKGTPGGTPIANLIIQAVDPATGLDSGVNWLDQTWLEARINGGANPSSDPAFRSLSTAWYPLGRGNVLPAPDLPGNCAYYVEIRLHPPLVDGTSTETVNFKLQASYNNSPLNLGGVVHHYRQSFTIAASAYTDCTFSPAPSDCQVVAVSGFWKTQPTSTTTADVGVSGATTRYVTAGSTVLGSTFKGLIDGVRYYATGPVVRVTPDTTPGAADGVLSLTLTVIDIQPEQIG